MNITPEVDAVVRKSGVREGMVLVNAMHNKKKKKSKTTSTKSEKTITQKKIEKIMYKNPKR